MDTQLWKDSYCHDGMGVRDLGKGSNTRKRSLVNLECLVFRVALELGRHGKKMATSHSTFLLTQLSDKLDVKRDVGKLTLHLCYLAHT